MNDPIIALWIIALITSIISLFRPGRAEVKSIVRYVHDGDTFYLKGVKEPIRIWGIDAPEIGDPGGAKSKGALKRLALGKSVRCVKMDRDHYNRIVAKCFLSDGRDIAAELVKRGHAFDMPRYSGGYYKRMRK